jgi:hypothetical protein
MPKGLPKSSLWYEKVQKPFGEASKNGLLRSYKKQANKRNIEWTLTDAIFFSLAESPCYYCGVNPYQQYVVSKRANGSYTYNGLDRVDDFKGYTKANCVPCCGICNYAKRSMLQEDFLMWLDRIAAFRRK